MQSKPELRDKNNISVSMNAPMLQIFRLMIGKIALSVSNYDVCVCDNEVEWSGQSDRSLMPLVSLASTTALWDRA